MKNLIVFLMLVLSTSTINAQQIRTSSSATITFFSSTIVEDIEAKSASATSAFDVVSGNLLFRVKNTSFQFPKKLMQEHFNENYMESDTYPLSDFKGKISPLPDFTKDGTYTATATGNLNIHGVTKTYTAPVTFTITGGNITAKTVFRVRISDHGIKVPALVFKNIAEFVEVRVVTTYLSKNN
ncbi:YceI family protein [Pedobacter duraquae]|uniref:YceI-like domain-containing protein n=1 Tax=Pedobacter duraquae TaxID=425511 RepID=A0A4R6IHQ2_9SPHI|nr:YceI family protein [Pedobacter duraquae]TDO20855.1 YceI-like domain-containing protein [Pedobacter duraquae]